MKKLKAFSKVYAIDLAVMLAGFLIFPTVALSYMLLFFAFIRGVATTLYLKSVVLQSLLFELSIITVAFIVTGFNPRGIFSLTIVNVLILTVPFILNLATSILTAITLGIIKLIKKLTKKTDS